MDKFKKSSQILGRALYIIFIRWGIIAIGAIFLVWYLQYRVSGNDANLAWDFWDEKPAIFWYSSLMVFCLAALVYGITRRPFLSLGIVFAFFTIISYINNTKVSFRGTPLLPEDFQLSDQAGTLTKFIDVGALVKTILAACLSVGLGGIIDYLTMPRLNILPKLPKVSRKKPKTKKAKRLRKNLIIKHLSYGLIPRIIIIPLAIWGLLASTSVIIHHEAGAYQTISWIEGTDFVAWNQSANYERNGFLFGFLYNVDKASLEKPENYNSAEIAKIKTEYQNQSKEPQNATKPGLNDANYNIVIVLNESYYDASLIQAAYPFTGEDPLPTFHTLMKNYPAGYMYSTDYGGGTANIEFEVDTGLSNFWSKTVPYTDIVPKIDDITSIAKEAKAAGYKTTAIHSFVGGMYKRDFALGKEGFDTFITEAEMKHQEHDGSSEYINDESIYQETLDVIKNSQDKQLISVITMQNHAPYDKNNYPEEEYHFDFSASDWDQDFRNVLLAYLESTYRSDLYLKEFLEKLTELGEETVVLFFGDHAPGIFSLSRDEEGTIDYTQLTPYFIWSNFTLKGDFASPEYGKQFLTDFGSSLESKEDSIIDTYSKYISLPTTTPNCLTNALYGTLGLRLNAERTLLHKVCQVAPILTPYFLGDSIPSDKVVHDYELLNYDILYGQQYWLK